MPKKTKVEEPCVHLYDGVFSVDPKKWGTCTSYDTEGRALVTSLTEENCVEATRCYLKWRQEGFTEKVSAYDGVVGGKL